MPTKIVETVDLDWHCNGCGKTWKNNEEKADDESVESLIDYDQMIYVHHCDKIAEGDL